jgi:hypothetical protein
LVLDFGFRQTMTVLGGVLCHGVSSSSHNTFDESKQQHCGNSRHSEKVPFEQKISYESAVCNTQQSLEALD